MKKIISCLLLAVLLAALAGCANTDTTPDGMQDVALESAGYHLYVPSSWVPTSYNVSGAKANTKDNAPNVVATVYYPDAPLTVADYYTTKCLPEYTAVFKDFTSLEEGADCTLGGKDAKSYKFSYTFGDTLYQCRQVMAVYNYNVYVVTYTAVSTDYDTYAEDVEQVVANFTFK